MDEDEFSTLTMQLLVDWRDGMIRRQIIEPKNAKLHCDLACPAGTHIHVRCSDAVYPFLHLAHVTGDQKYLDAAINAYDWRPQKQSQMRQKNTHLVRS